MSETYNDAKAILKWLAPRAPATVAEIVAGLAVAENLRSSSREVSDAIRYLLDRECVIADSGPKTGKEAMLKRRYRATGKPLPPPKVKPGMRTSFDALQSAWGMHVVPLQSSLTVQHFNLD
ncbi:hypothetical protein [Paraburkholderia sp. GAS32]|uniref:hypothetical protein n=1 Tax=Paraburkholderia sp. GAS32 TaxID=3035129 RepID=UPI003D253D29